MKKLFIPCTLILVGAMAGFLISYYVENQNKIKLYKSFYVTLAADKYFCLVLQNPEGLKNFQEQQFIGYLRAVGILMDPKMKGEINWDNFNSLEEIEDFGLSILFRATRDINEVEFSSDEIKHESIDLLEQIKSNNP